MKKTEIRGRGGNSGCFFVPARIGGAMEVFREDSNQLREDREIA
jgi:hypothetical protein